MEQYEQVAIASGKQHALAFYAFDHSRCEIHDVGQLLPYQLFRSLPLRDTGDDGANTELAEVDRAFDELIGLGHSFSGLHRANADIKLGKIIV